MAPAAEFDSSGEWVEVGVLAGNWVVMAADSLAATAAVENLVDRQVAQTVLDSSTLEAMTDCPRHLVVGLPEELDKLTAV